MTAQTFRAKYKAPGNKPPSLIACDGATSDVFYNGNILSSQFGKYVGIITNGTGLYCVTAQEDTAILSSLLRGAKAGLVDFGRIIAMRTAANFDRPPPGVSTYQNFFFGNSGGLGPSIANLALAGTPSLKESSMNGDRLSSKELKPLIILVIFSGRWAVCLTSVPIQTSVRVKKVNKDQEDGGKGE